MEIGISIYDGIDYKNQVEYFKKYGVNRTFLHYKKENFEEIINLMTENDIICETIHAPFGTINDMWIDDEEVARATVEELKSCISLCAKHNIPVVIIHLSSGCPMPEINEKGIKRYEEVFRYAEEKGVIAALENQRYLENLSFFLDKNEKLTFCWDNGHEYGFTKGISFTALYGDRISALHIHDNRCGVDTDDHLLPFDGNIDFSVIAKNLADSGYAGTLMLEVAKNVNVDGKEPYKDLTDEEYFERAVISAKKLVDMIEDYKN